MRARLFHPLGPRMHIAGPWPFITRRSYAYAGRRIIWRARQHRKGLERAARALENAPVPFWQTQAYNWWTGALFALGSLLFMLGSLLSLLPEAAGLPATPINVVFFMGSIPFTLAGYLQHFQAANTAEFTLDPADAAAPRRLSLIGWHPRSPGWLSTFCQFVGTVAFNFNTFDPLCVGDGWYVQDVAVWLPGMIGSVLFLVSGYLAYAEAGHSYWSWRPRQLDWRIVFINLLGCLAFMAASILAYVPRGGEVWWIPDLASILLGIGALDFFLGAALMMRESETAATG
ncbi:hypothetical protein KHC23_10455 [Ancylobacter dichloromethanicus]|uniref:YrhK domain-containing protein n=1 Tax=Ancylobacter dichloromethanicus TaxID=518825 RepID=A0A9W6MYQ4_9HYPH|nr:hypothetical protein [Ancylobacter dichloromethanicus]MBS7554071.1 hypothetical protein [Ancylobacter dichloromethanicus]GLK71187.1 hypothetical protein GCM10017643_13020 [Ancylobacter dichloromethanicus]